ncbi:SIS domain-containing protein [Desulfonema magnum]|uniref:SIS domain-containing protein n=1 Tax=Desulfonema magnum TaxID=45655 RepID=A0A975GNK9_9BACT|nr:SIS domain-containing protein [Desulfonema magnum]QTA87882.1 SIS domain-containing protein [Desulfonema magnum]
MSWTNNILNLKNCLTSLSVFSKSGDETAPDSAFMQWKERTVYVRESRKTAYLIGNGASASMASHFAADLAKNGYVRTQVFTDLSLITALGNDINYESVFAEPLRWQITEGDMLVAISRSGNSSNVLAGCKTAMSLGGYVVTLPAMKPDNALRSLGKSEFLCAC